MELEVVRHHPRASIRSTGLQLRSSTIIDGAIAGAVATLFMSAFMLASRRFGVRGKLPPQKITEAAVRQVEPETKASSVKALSVINHFAFGMGAGALYAWGQGRLPINAPPVARGIGFGLLVWSASYFGWVPALGIMPPAHRDRPGRAEMMAAAHVVYGAVLGKLTVR